jgi:[protein-PII] uridylyltransferase
VVRLDPDGPVQQVHVAVDDGPGLMAVVAGVLSLNRLAVRAATLTTSGDRALQTWTVQTDFGDPPAAQQLREDLRAVLEGRLDLDQRLAARERAYARPRIKVPDPRVDVIHDASARATILEVRAHDGPALLHRVGTAIARTGVGIRSARVATMGADAVDVFYLSTADGGRLSPVEAAAVAEAVNDDLRTWSVAPEGRGR